MASFVVDTNVAVVANGGHRDASPACVASCARALTDLVHSGTLVLDAAREIIREYRANLAEVGQPGVGDAFLKWILVNYTNPARCSLIQLSPSSDGILLYDEIPRGQGLEGFDRSDQKFLAVALASAETPEILNAVDTDWANHSLAIEALGINVIYLCPAICAPARSAGRDP